MRPSRLLIQSIVFLVAATYFVTYLAQGLPTDDLLKPVGAASSIVGLFLLALDNYLWRARWVGRKVTKRPNLVGTWRGTLS